MKKLLILALLALGLNANPLIIDSSIDGIKIKDQKEKEHTLDANIKTVIFASDKGTSDIIKDYLLSISETENILDRNSAVYVADISGMPSIISKFIALPKMKKYPFPILLLDDSNKANFTKEDGKIIVYSILDGKVSSIEKISTKEELANIIK
ncbi:hypothetical protein AAX26_00058 [Aliarcobacter thereius]|nr:hypothetical protein [Aliarcobacter thereius]OCL88378.1 hypothetical protein AAX26_00058 [Aliarcobacter thereius]OCL91868.1 hypothetical protein AAX25_00593 [Aliarcobacter thereius]OCL95034.1 hypothetical protein AA347_00480 [Aliarcobacter thereius LMG 24486]OCM00482.1 hypothetical protein AAX29_00486 [Aliarcobacter thereius]QBF16974.1 hypothetical protein ATH_1962 [Aliarcobacter thereius LMG 24486]